MTGIAVINTCLVILAFVCFARFVSVFKNTPDINDPNNPISRNNANNTQPNQNLMYQGQQQYSFAPYYTAYGSQNPYYISNSSTFKAYL